MGTGEPDLDHSVIWSIVAISELVLIVLVILTPSWSWLLTLVPMLALTRATAPDCWRRRRP